MKKKMPAFLEKKKRDPKSAAPAKNTKGRSVTKTKTKKQDDSEQDRGGDIAPTSPAPVNKADAALAMLSKPRNRRASY